MLTDERLEGGEQLVDIEVALGVDVPGRVLHQPCLRRIGELARHDLGVDGVRNTQGVVTGDQAEVADVLQIAGGERALVASAQQRLDDAANPIFLELVRELIQVSLPAENQTLLVVEDVARGDCAGAVPSGFVVEAGTPAQRVHQPGLAPSLSPHRATASGVNA